MAKEGYYKIKKTNEVIYFYDYFIDEIDENHNEFYNEDTDKIYTDEEVEYLEEKDISFEDLFQYLLEKGFLDFNYNIIGNITFTNKMLLDLINNDNKSQIVSILYDVDGIYDFLPSYYKDPFVDTFIGIVKEIFSSIEEDKEVLIKYFNDLLNHLENKDDTLLSEKYIKNFCYKYPNIDKFINKTKLENQVNRYHKIIDIGISLKDKNAITSRAYEYYEGSKYLKRDTYKAEELLNILSNEFGDEYAENTLGYIYYYYRKEDPQALVKSLAHFSIAKDYGVVEATYKVADIYSIRDDFIKNYRYAYECVNSLLKNQFNQFSNGNVLAKVPDIYLRLGSLSRYYKPPYIKNVPYFSLMNLLIAKETIRLRRKYENYIGDNKVQDRINIIIDEIDTSNLVFSTNIIENLEVLIAILFKQFTATKAKSFIKIIDKNHLILSMKPVDGYFFIIPIIEESKAKLYTKISFEIEMEDTSRIDKKDNYVPTLDENNKISLGQLSSKGYYSSYYYEINNIKIILNKNVKSTRFTNKLFKKKD